MLQGCCSDLAQPQLTAVDEDRRRAGDPRSNPALEVTANALGDVVGAPVALEALEVELEPLHALPEVRIIDVTLIRVNGIHEVPEGRCTLERHGLRGGVESRRPRVLARDGKVAKDAAQRGAYQRRPARRAMGTGEIEVEDRLGALPAHVVPRPGRGHVRAPEIDLSQLSRASRKSGWRRGSHG